MERPWQGVDTTPLSLCYYYIRTEGGRMSGDTRRERAKPRANDGRSDDELRQGPLHELFRDMLRSVLPGNLAIETIKGAKHHL
jgi:hypothetical protein